MDKQSSDAKLERNKAVNRAALRGVVSAYLVYLGISLILDLIRGRITEKTGLIWAGAVLFTVAGAGFGWYTWKRWKAEKEALEAAQEPDEEASPASDEEGSSTE